MRWTPGAMSADSMAGSLPSLGRSEVVGDRQRGFGLEHEVFDLDVLVGAVLDLEVGQRVGVAEGDEAVGDGSVGLAEDVAVAVAVTERGYESCLRVAVGEEV